MRIERHWRVRERSEDRRQDRLLLALQHSIHKLCSPLSHSTARFSFFGQQSEQNGKETVCVTRQCGTAAAAAECAAVCPAPRQVLLLGEERRRRRAASFTFSMEGAHGGGKGGERSPQLCQSDQRGPGVLGGRQQTIATARCVVNRPTGGRTC